MFEILGAAAREFVERLLPLYRDTDFAYEIVGVMIISALALVAVALIRHVVTSRALRARTREIAGFVRAPGGGKDDGTALQEREFLARFDEVERAMCRQAPFSADLSGVWSRYRKTFSFVDAPPVRVAQSPGEYFFGAISPPSWLGFAAGLFIAFGLLATFIGLIAALTFATEAMVSSDASVVQSALRDLLASAASKFITSVAGVGLSIFLRVVERVLTVRLRERVEQLSHALELGLRVDPDLHGAALALRIERAFSRVPAAARTAASSLSDLPR